MPAGSTRSRHALQGNAPPEQQSHDQNDHGNGRADHTVDPSPGKIGKRGEVFLGGQNFRLEATHLTG